MTDCRSSSGCLTSEAPLLLQSLSAAVSLDSQTCTENRPNHKRVVAPLPGFFLRRCSIPAFLSKCAPSQPRIIRIQGGPARPMSGIGGISAQLHQSALRQFKFSNHVVNSLSVSENADNFILSKIIARILCGSECLFDINFTAVLRKRYKTHH